MPSNWARIFNKSKREKLSSAKQKIYKEFHDSVFRVSFEQQSSDEIEIDLDFELIEFDTSGISIKLRFNEPLLVSQGEYADIATIELRKDLFLK